MGFARDPLTGDRKNRPLPQRRAPARRLLSFGVLAMKIKTKTPKKTTPRTRLAFALPLTLTLTAAGLAAGSLHCGGGTNPVTNPPPPAGDGGVEAAVTGDGGYYETEQPKPLIPANKVDLLFVVDNSASMGDKQGGAVLEHAPVHDLHVGVISTSLGNFGGDVCDSRANARANDQAHLLNVKKGGGVVTGAEGGFLSFGPGGISNITELETSAMDIIVGVEQTGCGLEAQLESMYRFLAQPDPPADIVVNDKGQAEYRGVDYALLKQRKAFLRPDSAVAVVMITDEDDSSPDPRSMQGQGWAFSAKTFPGSSVIRVNPKAGTTAPRGTSACAAAPGSPQCTSCGFASLCDATDPACLAIKNDTVCKTSPVAGQSGPGFDGYFGPTDDELNVRYQRMKKRYGVDPQFPIERYVRALTNRRTPNRDGEHKTSQDGTVETAYEHAPTCTNPLFAANLPEKEGDELCKLGENSRSAELVFFALIGGVPSSLLAPAPDWTKILGANPAAYDETGIDAHMVQSITPRAGLAPPAARSDNGPDPIHGREWDTAGRDLQYACTFALPTPRSCVANDVSCDCSPDFAPDAGAPPLCQGNDQVRGKAYPTIRELRVAKDLGNRAVVASICTPESEGGYGPLLDSLATRMAGSIVKN